MAKAYGGKESAEEEMLESKKEAHSKHSFGKKHHMGKKHGSKR